MTAPIIRALIIETAPTILRFVTQCFAADKSISIMATVADPFGAAEQIGEEVPDILILSSNCNRMKADVFVRKIMTQHPIPILILSRTNEPETEVVQRCLQAGAIKIYDCPTEPGSISKLSPNAISEFNRMVRIVARTKVRDDIPLLSSIAEPKFSADVILPPPVKWSNFQKTEKIICIGVSTGGPESLKAVLSGLPHNAPGVVIVQHMPETFTSTFAQRMNDYSAAHVSEASSGDIVRRGRVLIAPGNRHMLIRRTGSDYIIDMKDGPPVTRHRPSVDVLFRSAARSAGPNAVGVIMTGMGDDGAQGLLEMSRTGAHTIAESEETCIVFGMPKEAIARGGVKVIARLNNIASEIMRVCV